MTHQDDMHPAEMPDDQPTMELLDGAEEGTPQKRSLMGRILRGSLYGVILLFSSALLAISAVPELANYATFIPDTKTKSHCNLRSGSCTALDLAAFKDTPCCPNSENNVASSGGCSSSCGKDAKLASAGDCSSSCEKADVLASLAAGLKTCCQNGSQATDSEVVEDAPTQTLLTDEQLALLPEGEDLD